MLLWKEYAKWKYRNLAYKCNYKCSHASNQNTLFLYPPLSWSNHRALALFCHGHVVQYGAWWLISTISLSLSRTRPYDKKGDKEAILRQKDRDNFNAHFFSHHLTLFVAIVVVIPPVVSYCRYLPFLVVLSLYRLMCRTYMQDSENTTKMAR